MKKTIHDTPVDNTQTMNKGDDRIDASRPSRRKAIKTLAATTALAATASSMPLLGRYGQVQSSAPIKIGFRSPGPVSAPPTAAGTTAPPRPQ